MKNWNSLKEWVELLRKRVILNNVGKVSHDFVDLSLTRFLCFESVEWMIEVIYLGAQASSESCTTKGIRVLLVSYQGNTAHLLQVGANGNK